MSVVKTDALPKVHEEQIGKAKLVIRGAEGKGYYSKATTKFYFQTEDLDEPQFIRCETEEQEHFKLDEATELGRLQAKRLNRHIHFHADDEGNHIENLDLVGTSL